MKIIIKQQKYKIIYINNLNMIIIYYKKKIKNN